MDISVIGAGGAVGREIVARIVANRVLRPTERLQLVGAHDGKSARILYGFRSDLTDAYVETAPQMDIALSPEEVVGDVIVFASSKTPATKVVSRDDLAYANLPLFQSYADTIMRYGHGHEVVLIVTNPVELGVTIFADALGPNRVIGVGAYSDSLRFRREIAADLGMPRQLVSGFVAGEHGANMAPLWSSVRIHGMDASEVAEAVSRLRGTAALSDYAARIQDARASIRHLLMTDTKTAFDTVELMSPDIRVLLRPDLTHFSGSKTVIATAMVTVDMVRQIVEGREMSVAGQIVLKDDDFYGIHGAFGTPIILSNQGVVRIQQPILWDEEIKALHSAGAVIRAKLAHWMEAN